MVLLFRCTKWNQACATQFLSFHVGYRGNDSQRRRRGNVATPPGCCCVSALRWLQADANITKVVLVYWHASTILYPLSVKTPFQASLGIYWFNSILKTNKPHFPQTHLRTVSINMGQRRQNRQPKWNEVNRRLASLRVPSASTPNCGRKHWAWAEEGQRGGTERSTPSTSAVFMSRPQEALCVYAAWLQGSSFSVRKQLVLSSCDTRVPVPDRKSTLQEEADQTHPFWLWDSGCNLSVLL